ncbi:MAG: Ni/Fe hydrogenase subunit alpha [Armatimonadota bacterium]
MATKDLNINIDALTRVEGEAGIKVEVNRGGEVQEIEVKVFEPPRFFEGFMVGRKYDEVSDMGSRICGICSVPHQTCSLYAVEKAMGVEVSQQTKDLRDLINIGEMIMNLSVHMYMLAGPDFLGYESVLSFKEKDLPILLRAVRLNKVGDHILKVVGGRETHPISMIPGGFSAVPTKKQLDEIVKMLEEVKQDAIDSVTFTAGLKYPEFSRKSELIAISNPRYYSFTIGDLKSTKGIDVPVEKHHDLIEEIHYNRPHDHVMHYKVKERESFLVGPLARVNLNFDKLSESAKELAKKYGFTYPEFNPFKSLQARALELVDTVDQGIELCRKLNPKKEKIDVVPKAGHGIHIVEAPRGSLYYEYKINNDGIVEYADIITPTAHFVLNLENDLKSYVPQLAEMTPEDAKFHTEMLARSYDPCFSCSVH